MNATRIHRPTTGIHPGPTTRLGGALAGLLVRVRAARITRQRRGRPPRRRMRFGEGPAVPPALWSLDREDLRAVLEELGSRSR